MREKDAFEFYNLGLGDYYTISGMSGSRTGELLDKLVEVLPEMPEVTEEVEALPRFCVVGRPDRYICGFSEGYFRTLLYDFRWNISCAIISIVLMSDSLRSAVIS